MATAEKSAKTPAGNDVPVSFDFSTRGKGKADAQIRMAAMKSLRVNDKINPRRDDKPSDELVQSIKKEAGLINPLTVRPAKGGDGLYEIVCGRRRYRGCKEAGIETVPVVVRLDLASDADALAVSVAENSTDARTELSPFELGEAFKALKKGGHTDAEVGRLTGYNKVRVGRCLLFVNDTPDKYVKKVEAGKMSMNAALELGSLDPKIREAIEGQINDDTSAAQIKIMAKAAAKQAGATTSGKKANRKTGADRSASLITWRSRSAVTSFYNEVAYAFVNANDDLRASEDWFTLRGVLAALMWSRGEIDEAELPPDDPNKAEDPVAAKKSWKVINGLLASAAKSFDRTQAATAAEAPDAPEGDDKGEKDAKAEKKSDKK